MVSVSEIAGKLSARGREAFNFLDVDVARSPYNLSALGMKGGFTTLEELQRRKLVVEVGSQLGRMASPHTTYRYRLTPLGVAMRQHLLESAGS